MKFLQTLFARCHNYRDNACLTLTAIHPDGNHHTPSRHILLNQPDQLYDALRLLLEANQLGWGAFMAVGLRRQGLSRYRRGSERDLMALPAVFVDLDDPSDEALARLKRINPVPSCITFTGGGYHAYWWMEQPLSDIRLARDILRGLKNLARSDPLSPVQSLRLVGSRNTKPHRNNDLCRIVEMHDTTYTTEAFSALLPQQTAKPPTAYMPRRQTDHRSRSNPINPIVLHAVSDQLMSMGYVRQGDWLSGQCLYPAHHEHSDVHHSFGFNVSSGYGNCFRCGSILLKDICHSLGIMPANYGGLFINEREQA